MSIISKPAVCLQEYNKTDQFRDRAPTSIVYLSDDEGVAAAFVGFAFGPDPLVQVLPRGTAKNADCATANSDCGRSVQRLFAKEQVSLMKGLSLGTDEAYILLVAGRKVADSSTEVATTASPPETDGAPAASSEPMGQLQFSLYSYIFGDTGNRMEVRHCADLPT